MSISQDWITNELKDTEPEALHRSPSVEYSFYNAVRAGDMETVNKNCEEDSFLHLKGTGILSKNPLTNLKYHFVVTTAMLTRYCIDGGLEPEQAYRLSDFYILKMDSCTTVRQIADLHHIMARAFTGKMILQKKALFFPDRSCNAWTIFTVTLRSVSPFRICQNIPDSLPVICPEYSNRILEYP